ncbi:endonuclease/exonuclease/phosphatase family protein [Bdellovibrionota bacterium FG-2]
MPFWTTQKRNSAFGFALGLLGAIPLAFADTAPQPHTLHAVTFNLYNRPYERAARMENALQLLREAKADIIALQEIAKGWFLPGDPFEILTQGLQMFSVRYWHEENLGIFTTGLGLLSRFPIDSSEYHDFEDHQFWDTKGYLTSQIAAPWGKVRIYNLHMASTQNERIKSSEFNELASFIEKTSQGEPALILGDFNQEAQTPVFQKFINRLKTHTLYETIKPTHTWNADYEKDCNGSDGELIDHILAYQGGTQKIKFLSGKVVKPMQLPHASDHCAVSAELTVYSQ